MDNVSPDSSKKIKDVLAEFNESGSLKQYDSHEVRTFPFHALKKKTYSSLFIICSPLRNLAHFEELAFQHIFFSPKWAIVATWNWFPKSIHPLTVLEDYIIPYSLSSNFSLLLPSSFSVNHSIFYFAEKRETIRRDLAQYPCPPMHLFSCSQRWTLHAP